MKKRRGQGPNKRTKVQAQSSEDSEPPVSALQKRRRRRAQADVESCSDSDIAPPALKRRRVAQRTVSDPNSGSEYHDESESAAEPTVHRQPTRAARTRGRPIKAPVSKKRVTRRAATPEPSIAFPEVSEVREFSLSLSPEDRANAERLRQTAREAARHPKPASSPAHNDDSEAEKSDSSWKHVQIISELGDVSIIDAKNDPTVTRPEQGVEEFLKNQYLWGQEWRDIVIQGWLYNIRTVEEIQDELIEAGFRDQIEWEEIQYYLRCSGLWWADPESETVS